MSAKSSSGDLPPHSSNSGLIVLSPVARSSARPVAVEPVKVSMSTAALRASNSPVRPSPGSTFSTPGGSPASNASCPSSRAEAGESSEGLSTTVLPAASAGPIFKAALMTGKFQGVIAATTPRGRRSCNSRAPGPVGAVAP